MAQGGTLLLDEIGEMPAATQAKLLRVLENAKLRRLGGKQEVNLDVRVLASTNASLGQAIGAGKFREDLFYRLNVFPIHLPPLRERKDDISAVCASMLERLNRKHGAKVTDISPAVSERFLAHSWPGNLRELRNVLERAVILAGKEPLRWPICLWDLRERQQLRAMHPTPEA